MLLRQVEIASPGSGGERSGCESRRADAEIPKIGVEVVPTERSGMLLIFRSLPFPTGSTSAGAGMRVDQEVREARNEFRARVRRGLPAAPARVARLSGPNAHPEFVPMVFSSTYLV